MARTSARHRDGLTAHDDDLLAAEQLFGHNRGEAAEQVRAAIDHNLLLEQTPKNWVFVEMQ